MAKHLKTFGQSSKIKKEIFGLVTLMVFGAMTAAPLQRCRSGGLMLFSKIKKETSGLLVK